MFMEERHKDILKRINEKGRITVLEIEELYHVSNDCARRDLRALEEKGAIKRTHGGAIKAQTVGLYPGKTYNPRDLPEVKENYLAVAIKAITLIENKDIIYITTSQVGYYMAQNIPDNLEITVVTNSIIIAEELRTRDNIFVILVGGEMSHRGICHDFYSIEMIKCIKVDKAFFSHDSLSLEFGASVHSSQGVMFAKTVMKNSTMNIGVYPSEKIGNNSIYSVCSINDYDILVIDENCSPDFINQLEDGKISYLITRKGI